MITTVKLTHLSSHTVTFAKKDTLDLFLVYFRSAQHIIINYSHPLSPELVHLTRSLDPWANIFPSPYPQTLVTTTLLSISYEFNFSLFQIPHISDSKECLCFSVENISRSHTLGRDTGWYNMKNRMEFPLLPQLKIDLPLLSSDPTSGYTSKNNIWKRYLHPSIYCGFIHSQGRKQPKCPLMDEWIKKMHYMSSAIKK